jgi:hypothetical protein
MRVHSTRYAALALLVGGLACASNPEPDEAAAARDTTEARDTLLQARDTAMAGDTTAMTDTTGQVQTPGERTPSDTFLDQQGVGAPQDTAGYSGMERADTTAADTSGAAVRDTSGAFGADTTGVNTDTTGYNPSQQPSQDTTGQNPSQQPSQDTTSARY